MNLEPRKLVEDAVQIGHAASTSGSTYQRREALDEAKASARKFATNAHEAFEL
jgi:hypothetical protein